MASPKINLLSKIIYFIEAALFVIFALLTKLFFVDEDMGSRFKNFNRELLMSDILLLSAIPFAVIGVLFNLISKHKHASVSPLKILITGLLIAPTVVFIAMTPLLETVAPEEVGEGVAYYIVAAVGAACTIWMVYVPMTLLSQGLRILVLSIKDRQS